jgi:aminopeptidase-like protein
MIGLDAARVSARQSGLELYELVRDLYPIPRSLTGNGVRETLRRLSERIPLELHEVPTGTHAFDWTVPKEWNVVGAHITGPDGRRVVDLADSTLHVVGYSVPVRARLPLAALREHLTSIPEHPDWIPYRTSYYREGWGFCLRHSTLLALEEGEYEVVVDSTLEDGHLTYGEYLLAGDSSDEVLISTHVCHPSLANDNLSGIAVATFLAERLGPLPRRLSYRFLFVPGTIGAIVWLARNRDRTERIRHGLVLTSLGDPGPFTYKRSRRGDAEVDRAVAHVLRSSGRDHELLDFSPDGYDERQYCSPGFDLPVGRLTRTPNGRYPEYHTSADDLDLVRPDALGDSLETVLEVCSLLDANGRYVNLNPHGEPQLGRRGLYRQVGGRKEERSGELALLWVLNLSDGVHTLLDVAERSGLPFREIRLAADALVDAGLLQEAP